MRKIKKKRRTQNFALTMSSFKKLYNQQMLQFTKRSRHKVRLQSKQKRNQTQVTLKDFKISKRKDLCLYREEL